MNELFVEMENRFKLRISHMLRSSFGSCRTRNISDVVEKPVFSLGNHYSFQLIEPSSTASSPKDRSFPPIYKPRCSYHSTKGSINLDYITSAPRKTPPHRRKVSANTEFNGRKCPPASPVSPLNLFSDCKNFGFYEKKKSLTKTKKKNDKKVHVKSKNMSSNTMFFTSSSRESFNYGGRGWWYSSEDETETLFSSMTLSSDSSEPRRRKHNTRRRKGNVGVLPLEGRNKVKDSFAVVKSSDDPYKDFKASMVEMIIEGQIFGAKELEQLLQCFLSLNSHHHRIIVEVFTEICETLFSNWS